MIQREENLLFEPSGVDKNHRCKDCKYCFSCFLEIRDHCDLCGPIDATDYACLMFQLGNNTKGIDYTKRVHIFKGLS